MGFRGSRVQIPPSRLEIQRRAIQARRLAFCSGLDKYSSRGVIIPMQVPTPAAAMAIRDSLEEEVLIALVRAAWLAPTQYNVRRVRPAAAVTALERAAASQADHSRGESPAESPRSPRGRR